MGQFDFKEYVEDKYKGHIYKNQKGEDVTVSTIGDLIFDELDLKDQRLALTPSVGWAWGLASSQIIEESDSFRAYLFKPKQRLFWWARKRYPLYSGAFGSGKTLIGCLKCVEKSLLYPGTRGLIMRETYDQIKSTTLETLWVIFRHLGWRDGKDYNHHISEKTVYIFTGDPPSRIHYRPAKNETGNIQEVIDDLQSLEVDYALFDEAVGINEEIFMAVGGRVGRWGKIPVEWERQLMSVGNPPDEEHYLYKRFVLGRDGKDNDITNREDYYLVKASTMDNRASHSADYIRQLEAYPDDWKRTFFYGEFGYISPQGYPVYPKFDSDFYVSKKTLNPYGNRPFIRGWDISNDGIHKACVIAQRDPRGILMILSEIVSDDPGISSFGKLVLKETQNIMQTHSLNPRKLRVLDYADPAAFHLSQTDNKNASDILLQLGIAVQSGESAFSVRKESVHNAMKEIIDGSPSMIIDPSCLKLIKGFQGGYRYKVADANEAKSSSRPIKNIYSHIHDALQYLCSMLDFVKPERKKELLKRVRANRSDIYSKRTNQRPRVIGRFA